MIELTITDIDDINKDDSTNILHLLKVMHFDREVEDLVRLSRYSEEDMVSLVEEHIEKGYELFSDCFRGKPEGSLHYIYIQTMIKYKDKEMQ